MSVRIGPSNNFTDCDLHSASKPVGVIWTIFGFNSNNDCVRKKMANKQGKNEFRNQRNFI